MITMDIDAIIEKYYGKVLESRVVENEEIENGRMFYSFLRSKGISGQDFYLNMLDFPINYESPEMYAIDMLEKGNSFASLLEIAFDWEKAREGKEFWENINKEWLKFLKEKNIA